MLLVLAIIGTTLGGCTLPTYDTCHAMSDPLVAPQYTKEQSKCYKQVDRIEKRQEDKLRHEAQVAACNARDEMWFERDHPAFKGCISRSQYRDMTRESNGYHLEY